MGSTLVKLNGVCVWAYVVELADGLRVPLALDDCQRVDLGTGQCVSVRLPGQPEVRLFVTDVTELPLAWVALAKRVWVAE